MSDQTDIIHTMNAAGIKRAVDLIESGDVVAFPTETVYGLGANATNDTAVARIFAAKQRPQFNPLIVHFSNIDDVWKHTEPTTPAKKLAAAFWPGPLTLVLNKRADSNLSLLVSAGLDTVAVRVPAHNEARTLLEAADCPLAAPSANLSGSISPTCAEHVYSSLGDRIPLILDGGFCSVGLESTIVDVCGETPSVLRPGGVSLEAIQSVLEDAVERFDAEDNTISSAPKAPGQLLSHYAPNASVRLEAANTTPDEVLLGFGAAENATLNLSPEGDLVEAASNLFAMLYRLDALDAVGIAVSPIPNIGLGEAINDRLKRAAAPRD